MQNETVNTARDQSVGAEIKNTITTNKVLKNTYLLLGATLMTSSLAALASMALNIGRIPGLIMMFAALGLIYFVLPKTANSAKGIYTVFGFTTLLGLALGPTLNAYLALENGSLIISQALGATALIFFSLSAYVLYSKKDFSFMGGFLMAGLMVVIFASLGMMIASFFGIHLPLLSIVISGALALLMSGYILYDTSNIVNGGETNYIYATTGLYLNIYNLFVSLLAIMGFAND